MKKLKNKIMVIFSSHLGDEANNEFISHIHKTIGVNHDVICYTNYNQYSLPEVYNKAIDEYNNENVIMVFLHPDIVIKTQNWGKLLLTKFNNSNYSILGVAGSTYLHDNAIWWHTRDKMVGIVEHTDGINTWVSEYSREKKGHITPVVLIDGLFMAIDCNNIEHRWDEDFKGYHHYDLSLCVPNYLDGCNIGVTTDIRILHKSIGMTNQQWEENRQQFAEKYKDELPFALPPSYKDVKIKLTAEPKVTVIIPTKNNYRYIADNINSWNEVCQYNNYEILIADTGSDETTLNSYSELLEDPKVKLVKYDYYNFAKINNDMVKNHVSEDTKLVLFCNDDIKLLNDALTKCVDVYNKSKNVGTIGIRLHYVDGSIQHNGITLFKDSQGQIRLSHRDIRKMDNYFGGVNYDSVGNTGGFMLIEKELFQMYGGFNEEYIECLEDVELNLKCLLSGLKNITIGDAVAYHYESISRNKISGGENRFMIDYQKLLVFIKNNNILL